MSKDFQIIYYVFCCVSGFMSGLMITEPKDIIVNLPVAIITNIIFYFILTKLQGNKDNG